ncbi:MAG: hypothetical protein ACKVRO_11150 [Micropepsaceae bacterium]
MTLLPADINDLASAAQAIVTTISILVGGTWIYGRFVREQEGLAHIESAADIVVLGKQAGYWIVEIAAILENKGKVQIWIENLGFDLNAIYATDPVDTSDLWGGQVNFPNSIAKGKFRPDRFRSFFIGPGVTARYSWVARVPESATYVGLHCTFDYRDREGASHSMEKNIRLAQSGVGTSTAPDAQGN